MECLLAGAMNEVCNLIIQEQLSMGYLNYAGFVYPQRKCSLRTVNRYCVNVGADESGVCV